MAWWRKRNPEHANARVVSHGWHGHVVMETDGDGQQVVARVADIVRDWGKQIAPNQDPIGDCAIGSATLPSIPPGVRCGGVLMATNDGGATCLSCATYQAFPA